MALTKMSVSEYVAYRKTQGNIISRQAVCNAIRTGYRTPGIQQYEMYGGTYVLYVDLTELNNYLVVINKPAKLLKKIKVHE